MIDWVSMNHPLPRLRDVVAEGDFFLEQPGAVRVTGADTAEPLRASHLFLQRARERVNLAIDWFNPTKGEWGFSELLFGGKKGDPMDVSREVR